MSLEMITFTTKRVVVLSTILVLSLLSIRTDMTSVRVGTWSPDPEMNLRVIQSQQQHNVHKELRFLNFGTSVSWGAGLKDRKDAYPFWLSENVTNLAIRAQGPCFPSVCTQTMVGHDAVYDVITLEFFTRSSQGLVRLAKRLRKRYPKALIVVIRRWNPLVYQHLPTNQNFASWMEQHGYKTSNKVFRIHDTHLVDELFLTTSPQDWVFDVDDRETLAQEEAVEAAGAILLDLPRPADFRRAVAETSQWFTSDMNHLSEEGHLFLAQQLQQIIYQSNTGRNDVVGSWDGDDHCESWFLSGESDLERNKETVRMVEFDRINHKWAMEIAPDGGWVTVVNPFDNAQSLFLTYMVTGPPPSIYPDVFVYLGREEKNDEPSNVVLIDPTVDHPGPQEHVGKTTFVGIIPPGETTLRFQYWQHELVRQEKKKPFRLTGYAIVGLDHDDFGYNYLDELNQ